MFTVLHVSPETFMIACKCQGNETVNKHRLSTVSQSTVPHHC